MSFSKTKLRRTVQLGGTALGALVLTVATSNAAQANPMQAECSTTGAYGYVYSDYYGADTRLDFDMTIYDSLADGHHVRARLITKDVNGVRKNWPWHANTKGYNTSVDLTSYAVNSSGIFDWGVQVARFEGDTLLNSCTNWI
ncbi:MULTISPECIES: hypothetical protein [Streptomyces]|uniref:Uncharacterized protein n=1 Tax=Streptomyces triticiradicis TaxID=2651189 RepID=A0A7J5DIM9_9ACTN|nr:hypothetical protein [Streptomyces triticiradicis]KAB1988537.1 hypothetical protein F8144_12995 [Streptomyces triticiradicis]